jgi:peptide/nickel transport system ATP-binding protein
MSVDDTVVSLENLTIDFEQEGGGLGLFSESATVRAVDDVSLEIPENDVIALVGESGCGKTTLGKATIGVTRPTDGRISYRGQDIWDARDRRGDVDIPFEEIRRSLQIIHQDPGSSLNPNQRVISTLAVPLKRWQPDLSADDRRATVLNMLERVGMEPPQDYAQRYPHQLSGGEKQRVALVRALLMNPDLILADEAVSALDVSLRVDMMDLMLELQEEFNTSYLFISHDLSNAKYLAEKADGRIGVMYLGRIVEIGPWEQVIEDPQHPYTQVLKWATPDLRPDGDQAAEPPVRRIDIPDPTDPPSGCRFHTRCPEAREACTTETPDDITVDGRYVECFRADPDHEYWQSSALE